MAITTLDGVLAGAQPPWYFYKSIVSPANVLCVSSWPMGGIPAAGSVNGTLNGAIYSSSSALVAGQIPHFDPGSGNSYLARFNGQIGNLPASSGQGTLYLCDRLWDNTLNATITTSQSITTPTWPARDANGATAGVGILVGIEVETATTSGGTPSCTITYTNSGGTSGHTAVHTDAITTGTLGLGTFLRYAPQSGDLGFQSIQSAQLSAAYTGGAISLVAYRPIALIRALAPPVDSLDCITGGFPLIYNGTVPFMLFAPTVAGSTYAITGTYAESHG